MVYFIKKNLIVTLISAAIPLVDWSNEMLPIQFHTDPGDNEIDDFGDMSAQDCISLLNEYLDVVRWDTQVRCRSG